MKNRIDKKFAELRERKGKAFIAFITAGDPNLATTEKLAVAFAEIGVDVLELGVPFSDPMADGPTIQAASQRALNRGVTVKKILSAVKRIRAKTDMPIALMTYYNPIFHYGNTSFLRDAKNAGVDGIIVPDLPPEEARKLISCARKTDVATIFFLSPTTTLGRMKKIIPQSTGFIYYVSTAGVTGARKKLPAELLANVRKAKQLTSKPICVGFGVSSPQQVQSIARVADGVIVGSAIVKEILKNSGKEDLVKNVKKFVRRLAAACP